MVAKAVLEVLSSLERARCRAWVVAGGWGVDALVGEKTRAHRDVDLAIDADDEADALRALAGLGYTIETDWRTARVELVAAGSRWVDLHPMRFDAHGHGREADLGGGSSEYPSGCFVTGRIGGRVVGCLSVELQLRFRAGYESRDVDRHDLALLATLDR
jgi:lincosamide nucleotidyltransferase A/C/D/E